jgi:GxxExxY protein
MDDRLIYKEESYRIIGLCMEVHGALGKGHSEVVYKDALEYEFSVNQIPFSREKSYNIKYKDIVLPRGYNADFIVYDKIILEAKAIESLTKGHIKQTLNYPAASKLKLGLLVNFGEESLIHKRVVL